MSVKIIKNDMFVVLTYIIHDDKANVLEKVDMPISHIYGQGKKLLPKIENSLEGKQAGDEIEVSLSPNEGFGEYDASLVIKDRVSNVPKEYRKLDEVISFINDSSDKKDFKVTGINKDYITLDGNHYLAGKNLIYKIKILDVRESTSYDKEQAQLNFLHSKS